MTTVSRMSEQQVKDCVTILLHRIFNSGDVNPLYVDGVTSVEAAEDYALRNDILVYVWNEQTGPLGTSYSVSINGSKAARYVEQVLSRHDEDFATVRDDLAQILQKIMLGTIHDMCNKHGVTPKHLFGNS